MSAKDLSEVHYTDEEGLERVKKFKKINKKACKKAQVKAEMVRRHGKRGWFQVRESPIS